MMKRTPTILLAVAAICASSAVMAGPPVIDGTDSFSLFKADCLKGGGCEMRDGELLVKKGVRGTLDGKYLGYEGPVIKPQSMSRYLKVTAGTKFRDGRVVAKEIKLEAEGMYQFDFEGGKSEVLHVGSGCEADKGCGLVVYGIDGPLGETLYEWTDQLATR